MWFWLDEKKILSSVLLLDSSKHLTYVHVYVFAHLGHLFVLLSITYLSLIFFIFFENHHKVSIFSVTAVVPSPDP